MREYQIDGWEIDGPKFKGPDSYLSHDGDNPEAPWPGYGWPLDSECWYFYMQKDGRRVWATGLTTGSAWERAKELANRAEPRTV